MSSSQTRELIRKSLLSTASDPQVKLTRKEYEFVVKLEQSRLVKELIVYSVIAALVGVFLYLSLAGDIKKYS